MTSGCPFQLNNYTIHLRASERTLVRQLRVGHLSALVRHCRRSNVQAEAFYYAGEAPTLCWLPVCVSQQRQVAFKELDLLRCVCVCVFPNMRACVHKVDDLSSDFDNDCGVASRTKAALWVSLISGKVCVCVCVCDILQSD